MARVKPAYTDIQQLEDWFRKKDRPYFKIYANHQGNAVRLKGMVASYPDKDDFDTHVDIDNAWAALEDVIDSDPNTEYTIEARKTSSTQGNQDTVRTFYRDETMTGGIGIAGIGRGPAGGMGYILSQQEKLFEERLAQYDLERENRELRDHIKQVENDLPGKLKTIVSFCRQVKEELGLDPNKIASFLAPMMMSQGANTTTTTVAMQGTPAQQASDDTARSEELEETDKEMELLQGIEDEGVDTVDLLQDIHTLLKSDPTKAKMAITMLKAQTKNQSE